MRKALKKIVPNAWTLVARKIYRSATNRTPRIVHAYRDADKLPALKCAVSYNKYGGYCVPESSFHRPAAKAVLTGKVYEPETIEYMVNNCRKRDIIHAGTFFGDFLPALAGAIYPNAFIWAFEPNQENWRCAKITLELNETTNVRLAHAGLGARSEKLFVQTTDVYGQSFGGASRIVNEGCRAEGSKSVDIVAVDEIISIERDIGILQLDVEGYEKEALFGALSTIQRCLPILILEVLPNSNLTQSDWFKENILSLGYEYISKLHGNSVYSCQVSH